MMKLTLDVDRRQGPIDPSSISSGESYIQRIKYCNTDVQLSMHNVAVFDEFNNFLQRQLLY